MLIRIEINISTDTLFEVADLNSHWPGTRAVHRSCPFRWMKNGVKVRGSDDRVIFPTVVLNRVLYSSKEALDKFLRAINGQPETPTPTVTPSRRLKQAEDAGRVLQEAGI